CPARRAPRNVYRVACSGESRAPVSLRPPLRAGGPCARLPAFLPGHNSAAPPRTWTRQPPLREAGQRLPAASPPLDYDGSSARSSRSTMRATTNMVTSSVANPVFGQSVTLTATVATAAPGTGTPTGTVTFMDGTVVLGTVSLSNGVAKLTISTLAR